LRPAIKHPKFQVIGVVRSCDDLIFSPFYNP
jgi:hypothetical protein